MGRIGSRRGGCCHFLRERNAACFCRPGLSIASEVRGGVSVTPSPFAAASRLVTSPRTRTPAFVAIAALVTTIAAGLTFRRATTPWSSLPDSDYWGNISGLITERRREARPRQSLSPQQRAHRRHPEIDLRGELSRHLGQQHRTHHLFAGGRHRLHRAPPRPRARDSARHAVQADAARFCSPW